MKLKSKIFYLLFCIFSLNAGAKPPQTVNDDKTNNKNTVITVMTYNVHHCNPPSAGDKIDVEAIAKVINAEMPDLVALQEIDVNTERSGKGNNQAKLLAQLTGMHFYFSKAIDHQGGEYGVAILSKYPILDSASHPLPIHPDKIEELRTLAYVTIALPSGDKINFGSTHLGLKEPNRLLQAEKILEYVQKNDLPMILAGDFNAVPTSKVIGYLDQHFTRTCVADCAPTIPVDQPAKTIDFIMFRNKGNFQVLINSVISEKYASDHLPVVAKIRFKK